MAAGGSRHLPCSRPESQRRLHPAPVEDAVIAWELQHFQRCRRRWRCRLVPMPRSRRLPPPCRYRTSALADVPRHYHCRGCRCHHCRLAAAAVPPPLTAATGQGLCFDPHSPAPPLPLSCRRCRRPLPVQGLRLAGDQPGDGQLPPLPFSRCRQSAGGGGRYRYSASALPACHKHGGWCTLPRLPRRRRPAPEQALYRYRASALPATNQVVASWMKAKVQATAMPAQPASTTTTRAASPRTPTMSAVQGPATMRTEPTARYLHTNVHNVNPYHIAYDI